MNAEYVAGDTEIARIPYTASSGNVFADLGIDEPDEALLKADLAIQIGRIIRARQLTQTAAAKVLGTDQPKVSALLRGRLAGFTIDRLVRYAAALDHEVEVTLRPRGQDTPAAHVHPDGTVTLPQTLHESLKDAAQEEGVSLGRYVVLLLSRENTSAHIDRRLDGIVAKLDRIEDHLRYHVTGMPAVSGTRRRFSTSPSHWREGRVPAANGLAEPVAA